MEKITICIIDNDDQYRNALMGFLKSYCRNYLVNLPELTGAGAVDIKSAADSNRILLVSYEYFRLIKELTETGINQIEERTLILLEGFAKCNEEDTGGFNVVYKYSDIRKIVGHINQLYYGLEPGFLLREKSLMQLILCVGLSGGVGTSSIAAGIARELAKYREKRVFFLSLDMFESGQEGESQEGSHERLVYSLINDGFTNHNKVIENMILESRDGFFRMPFSGYRNVLHELSVSEKKQYFHEITGDNRFDYFVVDAGNAAGEFTDYLISNSGEVIIIDKHRSAKRNYMKSFTDDINRIKPADSRVLKIENFVKQGQVQTYENAMSVGFCHVPGGSSLAADVSFGAEIKKIADNFE